MSFVWSAFFLIIAILLTVTGYGYVHDGVLGGLILLSFLASAGLYLKALDERRG